MTRFRITFEVTCPSDWTEDKAKAWVSKLLCEDEAQTVWVMPIPDHRCECDPYRGHTADCRVDQLRQKSKMHPSAYQHEFIQGSFDLCHACSLPRDNAVHSAGESSRGRFPLPMEPLR